MLRGTSRSETRIAMASVVAVSATTLALALAGCAKPAPAPEPVPEPTASVEPTGTGEPLALDALEIALEPVASGLEQPLFVTHAGDGSGRLFVVEQGGRVRVVRDGAVSPGAFLDVSRDISAGGERGLLGLAFPTDYAKHGRFYVNYTDIEGTTIVVRFTADDPASDTPKVTGPETVLRVEQPYANHNGGCIVFGPDGHLWIGMGDGGSAGDPNGNGQNPKTLLGSLLRVDVEPPMRGAATGGLTYRIPADNGSAANAGWAPEVHAIGLRNPWRFSFDRADGTVWIGDVGQNAYEEIDAVSTETVAGANFGWNRWEGDHAYPEGSRAATEGHTFPVFEYSHDEGNSVTGGYVYRGTAEPELAGTYLYGDFGAGWIGGIRLTAPDGATLEEPEQRRLLEGAGAISSFGEDEAGEVYVVDYAGRVLRVTASAR